MDIQPAHEPSYWALPTAHLLDLLILLTPLFDELRASLPHIEFVKGLPKGVSEEEFAPADALIIIDDMIEDVNRDILSLFVKGSHHLRRSCILVLQNLYHSNPNMRTISLNSHYIVLFKQPRDMLQIMCLGKQMYPHASRFPSGL